MSRGSARASSTARLSRPPKSPPRGPEEVARRELAALTIQLAVRRWLGRRAARELLARRRDPWAGHTSLVRGQMSRLERVYASPGLGTSLQSRDMPVAEFVPAPASAVRPWDFYPDHHPSPAAVSYNRSVRLYTSAH